MSSSESFLNLDIHPSVSLYISVALLSGFEVHACTVILFPKAGEICFFIYRDFLVLHS